MSDPREPHVRLLFFAAARDAVGLAEVAMPIAAEGTTVEALSEALGRRYPALAPYMRAVRLAVNGEYAARGQRVSPGDEVAVIPPVAGG